MPAAQSLFRGSLYSHPLRAFSTSLFTHTRARAILLHGFRKYDISPNRRVTRAPLYNLQGVTFRFVRVFRKPKKKKNFKKALFFRIQYGTIGNNVSFLNTLCCKYFSDQFAYSSYVTDCMFS